MALSSEDDFVILICTNPDPIETETVRKEILISTTDILSWDLRTIRRCQTVKIRAGRNRLIEQSSYFQGLLCGNFSDSCLDSISIQWHLETFVDVLKCIYGCPLDVMLHNFVPLFEGALYFGVETLLFNCITWFSEVSSSNGFGSLQIQLDDLIYIWKFGLERANDFLPELCVSYLARNFMWAMSSESFGNVPYNLLLSCIGHPHLTVDSEMHLSDALLVWINANEKQGENFSRHGNDQHSIFRQIRISLLPLWFAAGKRRSYHFSKLSEESIDSIFKLMNVPTINSMNLVRDGDLHHLRIRLTEYSKKVNLSGCPQITIAILLLSVLPSSYSIDPSLRKSIKHLSINVEHLERDQGPVSQFLLSTLSFEAVQEVDISKCSGLHLEAAIIVFSKSFPSLRTLRAAYLLNFKPTNLHQLVQNCPLLHEVDLTVDISPLIPAQVSIVSSSPAITSPLSNKSFRVGYNAMDVTSVQKSGTSLSNITKLTLEGQSDLRDLDLQYISRLCASLHDLDLKGCISVTDVGIADLLCNLMKLQSIVLCDTSFGRNSVLALCSSNINHHNYSAGHFGRKHNSLAFNLQKLHMGGCKCVNEASLLELLSQTENLKSLCLRDTHLVDDSLQHFSGSSLEMLDVSNTMVSGTALAQIVRSNPGLKCLKARGCRNMFQQESNTPGGEFSSLSISKDLYLELGKRCKLEEIAVGWGFSCFSVEALQRAMMPLRSITVGLGGSLGEDALRKLSATFPMLESLILHFQVISDTVIMNIMASLRKLQVLALCYCFGDISVSSFNFSMPSLKKLRLERVTPWMTNADLLILTQNFLNLVELSLLGCKLLTSDSQQIISRGWPGLTSIHLEDCGEVTKNGVSSLLNCIALEDLLLRHNAGQIKNYLSASGYTLYKILLYHFNYGSSAVVCVLYGPEHSFWREGNELSLSSLLVISQLKLIIFVSDGQGPGIQKSFILDASSKLPMLRKVSLDLCDASEGDFDIPNYDDRYFLSTVKIARCKSQRCSFDLPTHRRPVHEETLVLVWNSNNLFRTVVKERL